jgi:hypothetical protein
VIAVALLLAALTASTVAPSASAQSAALPPAATAAIWGIDSQTSTIFNDPRWAALPLTHVRYFVPWDLKDDKHYLREAVVWLRAAHAHHVDVLLALTQSDLRGESHYLPSARVYRSAVSWLMRRYPWIREWTPWNEADLLDQATLEHPGKAAMYWRIARRLCRSCIVTSPSLVGYRALPTWWLPRFLRAARGLDGPWALHIYNDINEYNANDLNYFEQHLPGPLWVTEVGGYQHFYNYPPNLQRQAIALEFMFTIAPFYAPRVQRWYLYQWLGSSPNSIWDTGLLNDNGSARPALLVVQHYLTGLPYDNLPY